MCAANRNDAEIKRKNSNRSQRENEGLMAPMSNDSIVDRIIQRITNAILSGEIQPGQRIPTETELCESMQVGRNSVREAIKALVAMGVLNIRRAEGTFVADGFSDRMLDPMVYGLILEGGNSSCMIELRRMLEVGILNLAIHKATDEDIAQLEKSLENFCTVVQKRSGIDEILDADILFHRTLEQAVHNPLVEKISVVVERLSRPTRARATEHLLSSGDLDQMCVMHQQILNVLKSKDDASVAGVIDEHYKYWRDEVK